MSARQATAALLLVLAAGCGVNLLADPDSRAAAAPESADVAVGATHDLLVVACQDKVTLGDLLAPVAATAVFVGLGRLDAAFYLPGAVVAGANPKCRETQYAVSGAAVEGSAFELEATANDKAYHLHARGEGTSTFRAQVAVGGQSHEVTSTFRAWRADRLVFAPRCTQAPAGVERLPGHVPTGGWAEFTHELHRGATKLSGYGYWGVSHPRLTLSQQGAFLTARFTEERGPFTVTSEVDPGFALPLTAYAPADFDALSLARASQEPVFVGAETQVVPSATLGGKVPCVDRALRELTLDTPAVCRVKGRTEASVRFTADYPVTIEAVSAGPCRLTLSLVDGALPPSSVQFQVYRAFEATPLPDAAQGRVINLLDLWMSGPDELTIVGWKDEISGRIESVTLRRVNGAWGPVRLTNPPRSLRAVHGDVQSGEAFAVGSRGAGLRWSGTDWTVFDAGLGDVSLEAVWVNSPSDVYAAGDDGAFAHFDGASWSPIDAGTTQRLRGLWGPGDGGVWLIGWGGLARRFDGAAFTDLVPGASGDAGFNPNFIRGARADDVWLTNNSQAWHWDGAAWSRHTFDPSLRLGRPWPMGDGTVYIVATRNAGSSLPSGAVIRYDGAKAVVLPVPSGVSIGGWGNDVVVLGEDAIYRYRHDPADVFVP